MTKEEIVVPPGANMRDINDICVKNGLPSLAQGMIEFPPPQKLRDLAAETVQRPDIHTYRNRMGEEEYRKAIVKLVSTCYGETVDADQVLAVIGVAGGVSAAMLHMRSVFPDGQIALMEPFYPYHRQEAERAYRKDPVMIRAAADGLSPNFPELKRLVEAGEVQGVVACNPANPSGAVYSKEDVSLLLELADKHGTFVILDECYADMVFNGKTLISPLHLGPIRDNVVMVRGFSKCLGCQSWRVAYAMSTKATLTNMMVMMDCLYVCTPWSQHAIAAYFDKHLEDFIEHIKKLKELMQGNWRLLSDAFKRRFGWEPVEPDGTMYGMFKHSEKSDMEACTMALKVGVGICPGKMFLGSGESGFVRIHCGVAREKAERIVALLLAGIE